MSVCLFACEVSACACTTGLTTTATSASRLICSASASSTSLSVYYFSFVHSLIVITSIQYVDAVGLELSANIVPVKHNTTLGFFPAVCPGASNPPLWMGEQPPHLTR